MFTVRNNKMMTSYFGLFIFRRGAGRAAAVACGLAAAGALAAEPPAPDERYVRYGLTVQNTTGHVVPEAELWVCAPLPETPFQSRLSLDVSHPHEVHDDGLGNQVLKLVFSNVPPYAVRLVTLDATLSLGEAAGRQAPDPADWLAPGPLLEFDDEAFDRLAPAVDGTNPETAARQLFDWVRHHIQTSAYDATDRGARYALVHQKGDCTEQAALFAALCRRAGIPARAMGGYVVPRNAVLHPAAYHNWAEFFADGRWHLADPLSGVWMDRGNAYVATRVIGTSDTPLGDFPRFRYRGDGIKAVMTK